MFVSVICAADSTFLIKHMKVVAKTKYHTGRFHIPDKVSEVPGPGVSSLIERYHRLNFAWDLSKFVLFYVILSFLSNHFPYAIIQCIQVFTNLDRSTLEVVVLYLVGFEALLLPHALWFLSRRYKHALMYQWKVHVLRRKDEEEEDPYSCTLQSYTQRERDRTSLGSSRPPSRPPSRGAASVCGTMRSTKSDVLGTLHLQTNGRTQIAAISNTINNSDDHIFCGTMPVNGSVVGEVHVETHNHVYEERAIDTQDLELDTELKQFANLKTKCVMKDSIRGISETSNSTSSQVSSKGTLLAHEQDVQRSSSNASRKDWKDQMRKKHLPSIFINEGFDAEDNKMESKANISSIKPLNKDEVGNKSTSSLHFYMSSDFHPDYLTDTLPRHKLSNSVESDGVEVYDDADISDVLDAESLASEEQYGARLKSKSSFGMQDDPGSSRPYLSSFKAPFSSEIEDRFVMRTANVKGVYSTYDDLSQSELKGENEILFDPGSIPLDDISDGYNSFKGVKRKPKDTIGMLNKQMDIYATTDSASSPSLALSSRDFRSLDRSKTDSRQFNKMNNFEMASTSFGKVSGVDNKHENNDIGIQSGSNPYKRNFGNEYMLSSKESQNVFTASDNSPPQVFVTDNAIVLNNKSIGDVTNTTKSRTTSIDDENASSGSNSSVTLSPYKGESRRRPWMDDIENQEDETLQMSEPFVLESDTETLKDSHDSMDFMFGVNFDGRFSRSELSTPVSSIFDEETDRGFEEALEMHAISAASVYGGVGLCFESIKEESEDLTSSGSNPFLDNDDEFRTHAVISRNSTPDSLESSSNSVNGNPFSSSPKRSRTNDPNVSYDAPVIVRTEFEAEMADSGFTSGLEKGNTSDSSSQQEFAPRRNQLSPWPDPDDNIPNTDLSFETDFCDNSKPSAGNENSLRNSDQFNNPFNNESPVFPKGNVQNMSPSATLKRNKDKTQSDIKKPVHKLVTDIRTTNRKTLVRVKSLDGNSPVASRKPPTRGNSFEGLRTGIKPVYF